MNTDGRTSELLPEELVWDETGHITELAATAIADGEVHLLPQAATAHLDACERCLRATGEAALLSVKSAEWLGSPERRPQAKEATRRAPLPWAAIAAALAIAALGALPSLLHVPHGLIDAARVMGSIAPAAARGAKIAAFDSPFAPALSYAAAALLLVVGLAIVRQIPTRRTA